MKSVLEDIVNASPAIVFVWKEEDRWPVEFVSENISLFGYTPDDFISGTLRYSDIIHPNDLEMLTEEVEKHLESGDEQFNLTYRVLTEKKNVRWVEERTIIHHDPDNTYYEGIIMDITSRKMEEKKIIDGALGMKKALETVINSSPVIVFLWRAEDDWPVEFVSENITQFGYEVEEFTSDNLVYGDIVHPDDIEKVRQGMARCVAEGNRQFSKEYRILTKDGDVRWVDERTKIQHSDTGDVTYLQGIIFDITERKNVENALFLEEKRHEALLKLYAMSDSSIQEIMDYAREQAVLLTESKIGFLAFLDETETNYAVISWSNGKHSSDKAPAESYSIWDEALYHRIPIMNNEYLADEDTNQKLIQRNLSVPIFEGGRIAGIVGVANKGEDYTSTDVRQLKLLMQGMWNIIQQKLADEELYHYMEELKRSSEIKSVLSDVIKNSPAVVFIWWAEEDWPVEFVSENVTQFGYTVNDFISGKLVFADIVHPYDLERVQKELAKRIDAGHTDFNQEYRIMTKFGDVRWIDERTFIKYDEDGKVTFLQGIIVDITERKHANDFMHLQYDLDSVLSSATSNRETFNRLLDLALRITPIDSGALYLVDDKTGNLDLVAHHGLSEQFVDSTSHYERNSVQTRLVMSGQAVYKHHSELSAITSGKNLQYEGLHGTAIIPIRYHNEIIAALYLSSHSEYEIPDKSRHDLETIAKQIGEVLSNMHKEASVQKEINDLQILIDNVKEGIVVTDKKGALLYTNKILERWIRYSADELKKMDITDLYPLRYRHVLDSVEEGLDQNRTYSEDIRLHSSTGREIPCRVTFKNIKWNEKECILGIYEHISTSAISSHNT
ncbi:MAG: PAS domain-containing protein [Methanohalophilus sp.]